jgi:hypothetical protein
MYFERKNHIEKQVLSTVAGVTADRACKKNVATFFNINFQTVYV